MNLHCTDCDHELPLQESTVAKLREHFDAVTCPRCGAVIELQDEPTITPDPANPYRRVREPAPKRTLRTAPDIIRVELYSKRRPPLELPISEVSLALAIAALFAVLAWLLHGPWITA